MKEGILERKDGMKLMGIYQALEIDGTLRRPLTPGEMVTLFGVANGIRKGEIQTVETLKVERIGRALRENSRNRKRRHTIRLREKKGETRCHS